MRNGGGYVRLYRSMLEWEWYDDAACTRIMLHLLLSANWEEKRWHGQTIAPGQLVTSMEGIAAKLRLSRSAVRRAFDKLKATGEIAIQTNNHWTTVTLANWAEYQELPPTNGRQKSRPPTDQQPTTDRPPATTEEGKALEEGKKGRNEEDDAFAIWWELYERKGSRKLSAEQWARLTPEDRAACIAKTPAYVRSKPDKVYRKDGERYLRNRTWEDEILIQAPTVSAPVQHKLPEATGWITDRK